MESEKSARTPRCAGSDICARHSKVNGFLSAVGLKFERCVARTPEKQKPVAQSAETVSPVQQSMEGWGWERCRGGEGACEFGGWMSPVACACA